MKIKLITMDEYKQRNKYWIRKYFAYCGVCGKDMGKEFMRIYDEPRPDFWHERNEINENNICYGCY